MTAPDLSTHHLKRGPHMHDPEPTAAASDEDGSLVTEYGLLAVVAATVAGVLIQWATGGAVVNLFNALVDRARELVGA
jgi:Flp pilus assembly pilin Flp